MTGWACVLAEVALGCWLALLPVTLVAVRLAARWDRR